MSIRTELTIYACLLLVVLASAGRTLLLHGIEWLAHGPRKESTLMAPWGPAGDAGKDFEAFMEAGRYPEALQLVDRILTNGHHLSDENRGAALVARGRALTPMNRTEEALSAFSEARRYSSNPNVCLYKLRIYQQKDDQLAIVNCVNEFVNSSGKVQAGIYCAMIRALQATGQGDQARMWADRGKVEFPEDADLAKVVAVFSRDNRAEAGMQETYDNRFHIRFADVPEQASVRATIVGVLKESAEAICPRFRYNFDRQAEVVLYPSAGAFSSGSGAPVWAGADYDGRIRIPVTIAQGGDAVLRRVVQHEFTHFVIDQVSAHHCPAWLHEGLAQLLDGSDVAQARETVRQAAGNFIALSELARGFNHLTNTNRVQLAYAESLLAAHFISDRYGFDRLNEILSDLTRGTSLADALSARADLTYTSRSDAAFPR